MKEIMIITTIRKKNRILLIIQNTNYYSFWFPFQFYFRKKNIKDKRDVENICHFLSFFFFNQIEERKEKKLYIWILIIYCLNQILTYEKTYVLVYVFFFQFFLKFVPSVSLDLFTLFSSFVSNLFYFYKIRILLLRI